MISLNHINQSEAIRYMGYGDNKPDEKIQKIIDECEKDLLSLIKPRYIYKCFDIKISDAVYVDGTNIVLKGNSILTHLKGCTKIVIMSVTISQDVDRYIRTNEVNDMLRALVADSLSSAAVEQVCNEVEKEIKTNFNSYNTTFRFSPGYGNLDIEIQRDLLQLLDTRRKIGLSSTDSSILTPRKSVTAVIGLSTNEIEQTKRGCISCNLKDTCLYRRKGTHCGF